MIRMLVYVKDETEDMIHDVMIRSSIRFSWLEYDYTSAATIGKWEKWINEDKLADIIVCDVTCPENISLLKHARERHPQSLIIPVADLSVPAFMYVCPEIAPYSLIWKPPVKEQVADVMLQVLHNFVPDHDKDTKKEPYVTLESRQTVHRIPYNQIFFFEAREKKCFARVKTGEYPFYDTLGHLSERLPNTFLRCHKSYLVNVDQVKKLDRKERMLILDDGVMIPVSRNCYAKVKEVLGHAE